MIYKLLRYAIAILFGSMGYVGADALSTLMVSVWDEQMLQMGVFGISAMTILYYTLSILLAAFIGYLVSKYILRIGLRVAKQIERILSRVPSQQLVAGTIGLLFGLIIANLIGMAFERVPIIGSYLPIVLSAVLGYIGIRLGMDKGPDLYKTMVSYTFRGGRNKGRTIKEPKEKETQPQTCSAKVLDTSVVIDGRILDIVNTGFLEGPFIVPVFVLEELQKLSDSADTLKRNRGRRGLDLLQTMREKLTDSMEIIDVDYEDLSEVDLKLIRLSMDKHWKLITNDFNLNKVATLQGVEVLNLNDLANAIKPKMMSGETLLVRIMKAGKEPHQGVAYLDDGTMIVVENGVDHVDQTVNVVVTSVLQTSAGRMIFARVEESNS
ncbi:PIN/TRAM domain-containing protein [Veillonella sp. VA142]|uniref:PIN/TRAM domain-containing protein n=1 Tax=Veillonella sp. VA142 TaxID=741834 RepID=UPI000F8F4ED4|nr:TRAM domain-containing protein [Veillonella sp. VA142]